MNPGDRPQDPEPWLRGPLPDVPPVVMPVFFSFQQVREDLSTHIAQLSVEEVWTSVGKTSVGFHLKHIAGSVDRLATYLSGAQLSHEQLTALKGENTPDVELAPLLAAVEASLSRAEAILLRIDPESLYEPRYVGRSRLPTSVLGLLVHLAEHTQRHLGQLIVCAQAVHAAR